VEREVQGSNEMRDTSPPLMPRYWEAVTIGWRILWQGVGAVLLCLFLANVAVIGLLPELARTGPSIWAFAFPLLAVAILSLFVLMPLVVRALLTQPFGSFRLQLVRDKPVFTG
jgi:hypothetical protein